MRSGGIKINKASRGISYVSTFVHPAYCPFLMLLASCSLSVWCSTFSVNTLLIQACIYTSTACGHIIGKETVASPLLCFANLSTVVVVTFFDNCEPECRNPLH